MLLSSPRFLLKAVRDFALLLERLFSILCRWEEQISSNLYINLNENELGFSSITAHRPYHSEEKYETTDESDDEQPRKKRGKFSDSASTSSSSFQNKTSRSKTPPL